MTGTKELRQLTAARKRALAAERDALIAEYDARSASAAEDVRRELETRQAVAEAEEDARRRAKDAADAARLHRLMARSDGFSVDIGTPDERETWRRTAGISLQALGIAGSIPASQWWYLPEPRAAVEAGLPPVPDSFFAVCAAVRSIYESLLSAAETAAEAERTRKRERALDALALERAQTAEAEYVANRQLEDRLEGRR